MPYYDDSPFKTPPKLLVAQWPTYLLGSFPADVAPTRFQIADVALASNVATVTGTVIEGNIPAVGSLISIRGTQSGSGEFNVTNAAITAVSINATSGQGTISFALTGANLSITADSGLAIIPQPEAGEAIANGASVAAASPFNDSKTDGARTYQAQITFPTIPTACTVALQISEVDQDSQYSTVGTVATVSGGAVTQSQAQFTLTTARFLRFLVSGLSGTGTVAAKLLA
jgi:hypothetical protein